ncbi:TetR/AcrR family transcriptional regulator [Leifsonia aquatica]|uniref:TetR/AcrR family transcriptional regulator n=1 Tax=Leifsonia aquatica TaxID=144185 RepID=UPI00046A474B|nr:TetR/AcrR family transcriptional regulator [Leifsonia aquatica]
MTTAYHHGNLRTALLAQAEVALREVGVDGLSLRQVARDLGVSHGAPARHFRDKQALLDALALDGFEAMNARLAEAAAGAGDFRSRFERTARAYVAFATDRPELLHLMYTTKHDDAASDLLRETGYRGMLVARDLIAEAQAAGEVRAGDPGVFAVVVHAHMHGVAVLAAQGMLEEYATEVVVDAALDQLWEGIAAR